MGKKNFIFFILKILTAGECFSQTIYFNNNYDYNNEAEGLTNVLVTSDGGYLSSGQVITTTYRGLFFLKTDESGNTLWTKLYKEDSVAYYSGCAGSLINTSDGGYALGCSRKDLKTNDTDALLIKLNANGDSLWTVKFGGAGRQSFCNCLQNPDGSFTLSGDIYEPNRNMLLVRIDSLGNIFFQKNYGGSGDETALSLIQTPDSGYFLVGNTNSFGMGEYDIYIVKTDDVGNKQWQKTFGGSLTDGGGEYAVLWMGTILLRDLLGYKIQISKHILLKLMKMEICFGIKNMEVLEVILFKVTPFNLKMENLFLLALPLILFPPTIRSAG